MERQLMLAELASVISEVVLPHPVRVAVDGRDGSGKTYLADELVRPLRTLGREVIRASIDGFHNPRALRYFRGRKSPEGCFRDSFNYDALRELLTDPLGPGGTREYRIAAFDWRSDSPALSPQRRAPEDAILIVDGVFLLRHELRDCWDFRLFIDVSEAEGVARCSARDGAIDDAELIQRYTMAHELYLRACNPRVVADVIVENTDLRNPSLYWNT